MRRPVNSVVDESWDFLRVMRSSLEQKLENLRSFAAWVDFLRLRLVERMDCLSSCSECSCEES
jgi:hypothetical protein